MASEPVIGGQDRHPSSAEDRGRGRGHRLRAMSERVHSLGGRVTTRRDGAWFLLDAMVPLKEEDPA
ncbi:hypothetical protein GCM10009642_01880 [Nocardiopsis metallicus]